MLPAATAAAPDAAVVCVGLRVEEELAVVAARHPLLPTVADAAVAIAVAAVGHKLVHHARSPLEQCVLSVAGPTEYNVS